ncbi:type III secretion system export apparatus subunit SctU [Burkholderia pseudomallei]|uniref:type III secretion system export apparatus subunit SctU n=1 Tax=Burkholderia pseudomallei TaxID=28450 RepID=UPI00014F9731|nr:type III secretion system export apparatus subunit SctU [Burkholderia pseudomallei]AGR67559.1 type III secretion, YscU/HrpY family protein [Burkholderia pseudomallei MSHR305]AHK68370.1 type III secretion, YscU/HrpY family protein [Burkholderia pseudomallei MSHR520]AIP82886.1 type III secretion, YscU/HrpY family protein [Burkholderia pseudomallei]ALJ73463.1 Yop proteins translocation protein U [Burkholderia pseudomallei]APZ21051.1 EscU/YscU/HrcU family type III secretion system export appara
MSDEKTEEPTDKKLRDARRDGEVSRSTDLSDAVSMSAAILLLVAAADHFGDAMRALVNGALAFVSADHSLVEMTARLYQFGGIALSAVMPLLFVAALAGIGGSVLQVGLQISLKPVMPNLGALNPAEGLKKLFSPRSAIESIKMIVKAVIVFCVAWKTIVWLFPLIAGALYQSPPELSRIFREILAKWLMVVAGLCLLMGAADVKLQRFMFMQKMKMTKDEVKRESKNDEGDPLLKGERKRLARELAAAPPQHQVAHANFVVVNPTHYAVAIRYAPDEHPLPRVIAKGLDEAAIALRRAAQDANIPIIGNPPVARALFRIGVEEPVPEELFEIVAAILRWIDAIGPRRNERA